MILHEIQKEFLSLWKTSVENRWQGAWWEGHFLRISRKAKDTFSFINGTSKAFSIRHLREPNVQNSKGLPGEGEISQMSTSVKILSIQKQMATYSSITNSPRVPISQQPVLESTRSVGKAGGFLDSCV